MPCRDDGWPGEGPLARLQYVTRLLCEATTLVPDSKMQQASRELRNWYADHLQADRKRQEQERQEIGERTRVQKLLETKPVAKWTAAERKLVEKWGGI